MNKMWKYQKELEEVFRDYRSDLNQNSYVPRIEISTMCLKVSSGPDYEILSYKNGTYKLKYRYEDMRCEYKGEEEFKSEEEAILNWMMSFCFDGFPEDSITRNRFNEFKSKMNDLCK